MNETGLSLLIDGVTGRKVEVGGSLLFGKTEVGQFTRGAKSTVATNLSRNKGKIVANLFQASPDFQWGAGSRSNRIFELNFQTGSHTRGL